MTKAPCKGCKDRTIEPNCHMSCTKYIEFAEECKRANDVRKIISEQEFARRALFWPKTNKASTVFKSVLNRRKYE